MSQKAKSMKIIANTHTHIKKKNPIDWPFATIIFILVTFGLVMVFSASTAYAYYRMEGDSFVFIRQQALFAVTGIVFMFAISFFDYHLLQKFAWPIMGVTLALLVLVLFMDPINGARRWINLGVTTFQPSEIAKFAVIILFAHIISVNYDKMGKFMYGVVPFLAILGTIAGLMILEPHLSGTILILGIGFAMMFVGGTKPLWFVIAICAVVGAIAGALIFVEDLVPYAMNRITYWRDPFSDPSDNAYQTIQGMYAISSGGLFGLGIGNSRQKHLYVPEPANDFIFAILCEELGFVGAMIVILLFLFLLMRGLYIAFNAKDKFGCMVVVGIVVQITLQAALNIAVVTNTIPNTGISLPFFSYGGTSLTMLLCEIGVVLSVSRESSIHKV